MSRKKLHIENARLAELSEAPDAAKWEQYRKEAALEREAVESSAAEAAIEAAYHDPTEPTEGGPRSQALDKELADDWQHLKRIAMTKFPEGAALLGLTPKNRLVAIAHCLGWSSSRIAKASGVNSATVWRWLNERPDIKVFIDEFQLRTGDKDIVKTKFSTLEYKAVQCIESILSDKDTSEAVKRLKLDAAKWVFARTRGEPGRPIEVKGEGFKDLLEALGKAAESAPELSAAEADKLFKAATKKPAVN